MSGFIDSKKRNLNGKPRESAVIVGKTHVFSVRENSRLQIAEGKGDSEVEVRGTEVE